MTSERLLTYSIVSIKVLYLPQNFYTSPKQISGYAPSSESYSTKSIGIRTDWPTTIAVSRSGLHVMMHMCIQYHAHAQVSFRCVKHIIFINRFRIKV